MARDFIQPHFLETLIFVFPRPECCACTKSATPKMSTKRPLKAVPFFPSARLTTVHVAGPPQLFKTHVFKASTYAAQFTVQGGSRYSATLWRWAENGTISNQAL